MKRFLLILIALLLTMTLAAVEPIGTTGKTEITGTLEGKEQADRTANIKVNLSFGTSTDPSNPDAGQKVVVGFTKDELTNSVENITKEVEDITDDSYINLTPNPETGYASLPETIPVYAFWQIQSGNALKVKLYTSGALTSEKGGSIAWKITNSVTQSVIAESTESESTDSQVIYTHDPSKMGNAGSVKLNIETTSSYLDQPAGDYSGYIYIEVLNPGD